MPNWATWRPTLQHDGTVMGFNVVVGDVPDSDIAMFFSEVDGIVREPINIVPSDWRMCHLMHALGLFPSVRQARKNGWDKEIPIGFTEHAIAKRIRIWIWKDHESFHQEDK